MMVGRGARSTSCLSGRTGRAMPDLSLLVRQKKNDGLMSTYKWKQSLFKNKFLCAWSDKFEYLYYFLLEGLCKQLKTF